MSRKYEVANYKYKIQITSGAAFTATVSPNPESAPEECVIALEGACTRDKTKTEKDK